MLYDDAWWSDIDNGCVHNNGMNIAWADGHAKWMERYSINGPEPGNDDINPNIWYYY